MIQALFPVRLAKFALMPVLLSFGLLLSVLLPAAVASGCARGTPADAVAPEQQSSDVAAAGQEKPDAAHRAPFDLASGRPMVMMTVNGKGPYPFVFDTGAPGLLLMQSLSAANRRGRLLSV
jgi:hypothetical protein